MRPTTPGPQRRSRRAPRLLALASALVAARTTSVGIASPAVSVGSTVLCTGYDACAAAGYPDAGYEANASTSWWRQYAGHNCTNHVA